MEKQSTDLGTGWVGESGLGHKEVIICSRELTNQCRKRLMVDGTHRGATNSPFHCECQSHMLNDDFRIEKERK